MVCMIANLSESTDMFEIETRKTVKSRVTAVAVSVSLQKRFLASFFRQSRTLSRVTIASFSLKWKNV